jgi:hypothetical protein
MPKLIKGATALTTPELSRIDSDAGHQAAIFPAQSGLLTLWRAMGFESEITIDAAGNQWRPLIGKGLCGFRPNWLQLKFSGELELFNRPEFVKPPKDGSLA